MPRLLAHRGRRASGPENARRAVVGAFRACDGAEVDVLVTADGVPILRHDDRLPDGSAVRSLPLADLRRVLAADADDVPTVADVLAALVDVGAATSILNLELKVPGAARALAALGHPLARVVFTSFFAAEVLEARERFPHHRAGLLVASAPVPFVPPGAGFLAVEHRALPAVCAAHPTLPLWTWTVNDAEAAGRAAAAGAEVWIGDDPDALAAWG